MELVDTLLGAGGALATAAAVAVAWIGWRRARYTAGAIHDERVSPHLIERIDVLESRLDARDEAIGALRDESAALREAVQECVRDREELARARKACHDEVADLRGHIIQLQGVIERRMERRDEDVTRRVRVEVARLRATTPPGEWAPDAEKLAKLEREREREP